MRTTTKLLSVLILTTLIISTLMPLSAHAATASYAFSDSDDYIFDPSKIEFQGGTAQLIATSTPAWYDQAWLARKPITVDNSANDSSLTDYQIKVVLTYDSDMRTDFGDIRFTDQDGTTLLDYWLEAKTNSTEATFWVKVPTLPAESVATIYAYYGNSSAVSLSDGDNTFMFFDDFELPQSPALNFGVFTSVEYGVQDASRLSSAVTYYNSTDVSFVVNNGDFIDGGPDKAATLSNLDEIEAVYSGLSMPRYYVFGNHDLDYISKQEYMDRTGKEAKYESFDVGDYHFIILDVAYRTDDDDDDYDSGNFNYEVAYIPPAQRAWLTADLAATDKKTMVFAEYNLTTMDNCQQAWHVVANAAAVRTILENSGKVTTVFHGHTGTNCSAELNGIQYIGLRAMDLSTPNAYSVVSIYDDNNVSVQGFGEQEDYDFFGYDTSKWGVDGNPVVELDGGGTIVVDSNSVSTWDGLISNFSFDRGVAEFRIINLESETALGILKPTLSGTGRDGIVFLPADGNELRKYVANTATNLSADYPSMPFTGKIEWDGDEFWAYYNNSLQWNSALPSSDLKIVMESRQTNEIELDWVFVREYAENDPGVTVGSEHTLSYANDNPSIQPLQSTPFTSLSGFEETSILNGGAIGYQISNNGGDAWYWYDSVWATTTDGFAESSSATTINTNIATLPIGDGLFLFRAYLNSDGEQLVIIDDVTLTYTFVEPDTTPPIISSISSGIPGTTSATITWTTDEPSDSQVQYGITDSYGSITELDTATTTSHSVFLDNLDPETLYHYQIITTDIYSNTATSSNQTFTTQALPDDDEDDEDNDTNEPETSEDSVPSSSSSTYRRTPTQQSIATNDTLEMLMKQLIILLQQLLSELLAE